MIKRILYHYMIYFQRSLLEQKNNLMTLKRQFEKEQEAFYLELLTIADTCERLESRSKPNEHTFDPKATRIINSYGKIKPKLLNLLASYGVKPIEFQDQLSQIGLCEVVDVVTDSKQPPGKIIETIKTGYRFNNKILRPAQVVKILRPAQVVTSKCD